MTDAAHGRGRRGPVPRRPRVVTRPAGLRTPRPTKPAQPPDTGPVPPPPPGGPQAAHNAAAGNRPGANRASTPPHPPAVINEVRAVDQGLHPRSTNPAQRAAPNTEAPTPRRRFWSRRGPTEGDFREIPYTRLGNRIFFTIIALAVSMLAALVAFGFLTFPRLNDIRGLVGTSDPAELARSYADAREAWVNEMTTLGQLYLFGSIVPILATVIGYLLGDKRSTHDG